MCKEILSIVKAINPENLLDCTLGLGGHSREILQNTKSNITAIDCDPHTLPIAEDLKQIYPNRFRFINKKFSQAVLDLSQEKESLNTSSLVFNCVLADFGISSFQIDDETRGFSYKKDGHLSMSMCSTSTNRCNYLINQAPVGELAKIIRTYGEERCYYSVAKKITENRPIKSTLHLREIIESAVQLPDFLKIKTVARVFQAIRVYTNEEIVEIRNLLHYLPQITNEKTVFIFIYFHSLEGKEVFKFLSDRKKKFKVTSQFSTPSFREVKFNSRARSARLLVISPIEVQ